MSQIKRKYITNTAVNADKLDDGAVTLSKLAATGTAEQFLKIDALGTGLEFADVDLSSVTDALNAEITNRQNADAAEITNRNAAIAVETTNRQNADALEVTNRNDAITSRVDAEATLRADADAAEITNRNNAIAAEATIRADADLALQQSINGLVTGTNFLPLVKIATADPQLGTAVNGDLLSAILPLLDDDTIDLTIADFAAGDYLLYKNGASSRMWYVYSDTGVLKVRNYRNLADDIDFLDGDTFVVAYDVVDAGLEGATAYYARVTNEILVNVFKIADFDWNLASGIGIDAISGIDALTVQGALAELDGDIKAEYTGRCDAIKGEQTSRQAMTLQTVYGQDSAADAAICTNTTRGSVVINGTQSLKICATNGLDMTNKAITTTTSNQGITVEANGTGAFIVDGTAATVGDARGTNAIDIQTSRATGTKVASGAGSTIVGGSNNMAAGDGTTVIGGGNNSANASGQYGIIAGGSWNLISHSNAGILAGYNNWAAGQFSAIIGGSYNKTGASASGAVVLGKQGFAAGSNDFSIGSGSGSALATDDSNNHFHVDGCSAEVHIGRAANQAFNSTSTNALVIHTVEALCQSRSVAIDVPASGVAPWTMTLPATVGANGQGLKTDASGNLSWADFATTGAVGALKIARSSTICLTAPQAADKCFELPYTPDTASGVMLFPVGGIPQLIGDDYSVTGAAVCWCGLGMQTLGLCECDKIYVMYFS